MINNYGYRKAMNQCVDYLSCLAKEARFSIIYKRVLQETENRIKLFLVNDW